jgi:hypothetical protein
VGATGTAVGVVTAAAGSAALAGRWALVAVAVPVAGVLLVLVWVLANPDRSTRLAEILRAARGGGEPAPRGDVADAPSPGR